MTGQFEWLCAADPASFLGVWCACPSPITHPLPLFPWTLISPLFYWLLSWHLPRIRDATQPWPFHTIRWPLSLPHMTSDLGADSLINCGMLWFMSIFSAWLTRQQVAQPSIDGEHFTERGKQCKGLNLVARFCPTMAPTLVQPYIILTFLYATAVWISLLLYAERFLLRFSIEWCINRSHVH